MAGIKLLGLAAIEPFEQLLYLALQGGQLPLGRLEFFRQFQDVSILLRDEFMSLRKCRYHRRIDSIHT
ncbi:MAG: hypothetical protein JRE64_27270 [Deltaproteobacteria bacterium]|nr:hypothetical protein [Deltaproteobacteria bacterium]